MSSDSEFSEELNTLDEPVEPEDDSPESRSSSPPPFPIRRAGRQKPTSAISPELKEATTFWKKCFSFVYDSELKIASQPIRFDLFSLFFLSLKEKVGSTDVIENWYAKIIPLYPDRREGDPGVIKLTFEKGKVLFVDQNFLLYHCPSFVVALDSAISGGDGEDGPSLTLRNPRSIFKIFLGLLYQPWNPIHVTSLMRNDNLARVLALANILQAEAIFLIIETIIPKILNGYNAFDRCIDEIFGRYGYYEGPGDDTRNQKDLEVRQQGYRDEVNTLMTETAPGKFTLLPFSYLLKTLSTPKTRNSLQILISGIRDLSFSDEVMDLFELSEGSSKSEIEWSPMVLMTVIGELRHDIHHLEKHQSSKFASHRH